MKEKIKAFYNKHKQLILYGFFGVLVTMVSFAAWKITMELGVLVWHDDKGEPTMFLDVLGSSVQWVVGVATAFITNKKWVFVDAERGWRVTIRQLVSFTGSRVLTFFIEALANLGLIEVFDLVGYKGFHIDIFGIYEFDIDGRLWAKVLTAVIVVILNYIISKLFVFKNTKKPQKDAEEKNN